MKLININRELKSRIKLLEKEQKDFQYLKEESTKKNKRLNSKLQKLLTQLKTKETELALLKKQKLEQGRRKDFEKETKIDLERKELQEKLFTLGKELAEKNTSITLSKKLKELKTLLHGLGIDEMGTVIKQPMRKWESKGLTISNGMGESRTAFSSFEAEASIQDFFKNEDCKSVIVEFNNQQLILEKDGGTVDLAVRIPNFRELQNKSKAEDSLALFRPFWQQKPTHGRKKSEIYNEKSLVEVTNKVWPDWKEKGIFIGKKYDGATVQIHKKGNKVYVWTEDGSDVSANVQSVVSEMKKKAGDWAVLGELEYYKDGIHQPRATTSGLINVKIPREEGKDIRITLYDKLYHAGTDLHKATYERRRKQLLMIKDSPHVKVSRVEPLVKDERKLVAVVKKMSGLEGSEGAMLKKADMQYELELHPSPVSMIKFKTERYLIVKVIAKHLVKGATKTWYYDCALPGVPYVGRTYNTSIDAKVGQKVKVVFVDISEYKDKATGRVWFNWWAPRLVEISNEPISSKEKAHKFVLATTGRIQVKTLPKKITESKEPAKGALVTGGLKDQKCKEPSYPLKKKKKKFSEFAEKRFVMQHHWRGKSVHVDWRFEYNGYLSGFTLGDAFEGAVKENIDTMQEAKAIESRSDVWKVDWSTGEPKVRRGKTGEMVEKIWSAFKAKQPKGWLTASGITPARKGMLKPLPGGTKENVGVFYIFNKGTFDMGAQKSTFKEYFIKSGKFTGRVVFRLVPLKGVLKWLYWKPDDHTPYVLSRRAERAGWLADGYSALPKSLEKKIPDSLNYWKKGLTRQERLRRRTELRKQFKKQIREKEMSSGFFLTKRWWKGQEVVRKLPVADYHIRVAGMKFHLNKNPVTTQSVAAHQFKGAAGYFTPGKKKPKTEVNPNKRIPAFVEVMDKGEVEIERKEATLVQILFKGKHLKGMYIFRRSTPSDEVWELIKQKGPFTERSVEFTIKEFTARGGVPVMAKDLKFPYPVHSVGFAEGTWHKTFYPWDVVRKSAHLIVGSPFVIEHEDGFMEEVGEVTDFKIDDKKKWMEVFGYLYDTEPGRHMAVLHANKKVPAVSVRLSEWTEMENGREVCRQIAGFPHVAFVRSPEVSIAKIVYDSKSSAS